MEKQSRKQSSKHGNSSNKINSKSNKNLYMSKLREAKNSLEQKAKEIIVPVLGKHFELVRDSKYNN